MTTTQTEFMELASWMVDASIYAGAIMVTLAVLAGFIVFFLWAVWLLWRAGRGLAWLVIDCWNATENHTMIIRGYLGDAMARFGVYAQGIAVAYLIIYAMTVVLYVYGGYAVGMYELSVGIERVFGGSGPPTENISWVLLRVIGGLCLYWIGRVAIISRSYIDPARMVKS